MCRIAGFIKTTAGCVDIAYVAKAIAPTPLRRNLFRRLGVESALC